MKKQDVVDNIKRWCEMVVAICMVAGIVSVPLNYIAKAYIRGVIKEEIASFVKHNPMQVIGKTNKGKQIVYNKGAVQ